jgi:hypothetical protein
VHKVALHLKEMTLRQHADYFCIHFGDHETIVVVRTDDWSKKISICRQ